VSTPRERPKLPPAAPGELPPLAQGRLYVAGGAASGNRPDVFPTLAAALEKATAGQTVWVMLPEIAEAVTVKTAGVQIASGLPNNQHVVWRPPADATADMPLLRLEGAGSARVAGFNCDGAGRLNALVTVTGPSAGLRFEDLYLTDAGKRSIVMTGVSSTKDQPVTFERVRITTLRDYTAPMNQKSKAAIRPSAIECGRGAATAPLYLNIRWCRFEGLFLEAILLQCPAEVAVEFNRFYTLKTDERPDKDANFLHCVSVKGVSSDGPLHVSLVSNTMARFTHLLRLDRLTANETAFGFVVRDNLILGTVGDAWVWANNQPSSAVAKPYFEGSGGNVCRPGTVTKGFSEVVVPRKLIAFGFIDVVTVGSDTFLRYKKTGDTAALLTAGMDGGPVGVPPLD
jgi:hypothetical protein